MLRILIAEDEDIIRKGLIYTIDWMGMNCMVVAEAADGREGLEKILEVRPDVVITDICMPFLDGLEMIQEASKTVKFRSIILTSYADFNYAKRAISSHVDEYLLKPVDEQELKVLMARLSEEIAGEKQAEYRREKKEGFEGVNLEYYMKHDISENHYVTKVLEKIRTSYAEKISVESISEELGVSASYLSRKFKEVTEHTFLDFLNKYRVQMAIAMLNTGKYRVYEVSDATGFTDYKHFCSVFKKYTLMSPTNFIKNMG